MVARHAPGGEVAATVRTLAPPTGTFSVSTDEARPEPTPQGSAPGDTRGVVIGVAASAGGLAAVTRLVSLLPEDFPAAVALVQHLDPSHASQMAQILSRHTSLRVVQAQEGDPLTPGTIAVAPPGRHLVVGPRGTLGLSDAEAVHFVRPSADVLFTSMADRLGPAGVAVVLTGTGRDGATGVCRVHEVRGTVIVQDPETAEFPGMPSAAVASGCADHVQDLDAIPSLLDQLARRTSTR